MTWDTNGDGDVDIAEVVAGLKASGIDGTDEELTSLAQSMDGDGSGACSEWVRMRLLFLSSPLLMKQQAAQNSFAAACLGPSCLPQPCLGPCSR